MTVKDYNEHFLPKIEQTETFIHLFDSAVRHMNENTVDKIEVYKQLMIRGYNEETIQTVLTAIDYYHKYEGINKLKTETSVTLPICAVREVVNPSEHL